MRPRDRSGAPQGNPALGVATRGCRVQFGRVDTTMDHRRIIPRYATPNGLPTRRVQVAGPARPEGAPRVQAGSTAGNTSEQDVIARANACMPQSTANCPPPGAMLAWLGQDAAPAVVTAGQSNIRTFTPDKPFLGARMVIGATEADIALMYVSSIKLQGDEYILGGNVPASEFYTGAANAGAVPLRCWATSASPIKVNLGATTTTDDPVTVAWIGAYNPTYCG